MIYTTDKKTKQRLNDASHSKHLNDKFMQCSSHLNVVNRQLAGVQLQAREHLDVPHTHAVVSQVVYGTLAIVNTLHVN